MTMQEPLKVTAILGVISDIAMEASSNLQP